MNRQLLCGALLAVTLQAITPSKALSQSIRRPGLSEAQKTGRSVAAELFEAEEWRPAQWEAERLPLGPRRNFRLMKSTWRTGDPSGTLEQIEEFDRLWPTSIYNKEVRLMAAFAHFHQRKWSEAVAEFERAGAAPRERELFDEYSFKYGYALFALSNPDAEFYFARVGEGSWKAHALYYIAHLDYLAGQWDAALEKFKRIADHEAYKDVVPYYLVQIEFQKGNTRYVLDNAPALLEKAAGKRRTELLRLLAESHFHADEYGETLSFMEEYVQHGGVMERPEHYIVGYAEYAQGRVQQAIHTLGLVVGPNDGLSQNAAYHMAAAALELGNKRTALQSFSIAASGEWDNDIAEDALFNYGKLQYDMGGGNFNEAINVLKRYIDTYPQSQRRGEATEYLAAAYYNSKNYEAAYDAIIAVQNPDRNLRVATQRVAYLRGLELYGQGRVDEAYGMFELALKNNLDPKYTALTQAWMGEILARRGQWNAAGEKLRQYVDVAPSSAPEYGMALYDLGYVYFNRKEWSVARGWFQRFTATYNKSDDLRADALNRIGDTYYAARDFWGAIEAFTQGSRMEGEYGAYAEFQRAMMYGYVNRATQKQRALEGIVAAGRSKYAGEAQFELGEDYLAQDQFEQAARAMYRYTAAYPNGPHYLAALANMGLIAQNLGNNAEAVNYYKQVAEKAPNSPQAKDAMLALRSLYVSQNRVDEYFDFAARTGQESDLGAVQRDSLAFLAASGSGAPALEDYLRRYPKGAYRAEALYRVAEASTDPATTMRHYSEVAAMHHNDYTIPALEKLADMAERMGDAAAAAEAFHRLTETPLTESAAERAMTGLLRNTVAVGDHAQSASLASEIAAKATTDELRQKANLAAGEALERLGNTSGAMLAYRAAATDPTTPDGARATLHVIEQLHAGGDNDGAEQLIMKFAERGAAHQTDLARAFLILGDIYVARGDKFQARATWQSIVDGYSNATDGIVSEAKQKINAL